MTVKKENLISVADAAESLGVSGRRVRAMIDSGRLPATKIGNGWVIDRADLAKVGERKVGNPGRPRKPYTKRKKEDA